MIEGRHNKRRCLRKILASQTDSEAIENLLSAHRGEMIGLALRFAWRDGLRRVELCALTWEQVDFASGVIRIS